MKLTDHMRQLDLITGMIKVTALNTYESPYAYFNALSILNESAHIYGIVYLPSQEALDNLRDKESK